jgi:1-acyl-sn-glycerol-3-phosphate acyltransferase
VARPSFAYLFMRLVLKAAARGLLRVRVNGDVRIPGGSICAALPHRNWVEPFLLVGVLPAAPRLVGVADGPTLVRSWWRILLVRLVGGVVPVWPRASAGAFAAHVAAVRRALEAGAVVAIFPETGPPARPPDLRRLSPGVARFAAAAGAPVVPVVFGGTDELYLGRRIEVRVLEAIAPPPPDADRAAIDDWMADFRAVTTAAATAADARANAPPPRRKRWLWLTGKYPRAR